MEPLPPAEASASSAPPPPRRLDEITASLDRLIAEADTLAREIGASLAARSPVLSIAVSGGAVVHCVAGVADHVLPLGLLAGKEPSDETAAGDAFAAGAVRARYLVSLRRRRIRLQREGRVLAQRMRELQRRSERLRLASQALSGSQSGRRAYGGLAIEALRASRQHREAIIAWAAETASHRRRVLDWAERVTRHRRRAADVGF